MLHTNSESFEVGYCGFGQKGLYCNYLLNYIYDNNSSYDPNFCPIFKKMIDPRDQKEYRTVVIESQEWMAQNLDYRYVLSETDSNSFCYNDSLEYCKKYGRLYTWAAAIDSASIEKNGYGTCGFQALCNLYPSEFDL